MTDVGRTNSASPPAGADAPAGELVKRLTEQMSQLVRDEVKLAAAEMADKGARAGRGAGLFGGSGILALYGIACLIGAAVAGLSHAVEVWLAALVIGVAVLALAGVTALIGRSQLRKAAPPVPSQAAESVKADIQEIRERAHR